MNKEEVINLFKCLSDNSRLSILECLSKEDMYVEKISQMLDLSASTVSFHLKKMEQEKILNSYKDQYFTMFSLNKEYLDKNILKLISNLNTIGIQEKNIEYRNDVLSNFFINGKLKTIPVQRKKREIVLSEILKSFEINKIYTEKEVNIIIADFHDDFCFIRREMIAFGMMKRDKGNYWVNKDEKTNSK